MTATVSEPPSAWQDAVLGATMLAVDPHGLRGIHVRARQGPVRDRWLELMSAALPPDMPVRRVSGSIPASRLVGGLDIANTIERGRPVVERGVLCGADRGVLVLATAERLEASAAAMIGIALDAGEVRVEREGISARQSARFALVALDEGIDEEELSPALADRLGLRIDLGPVGFREAVGEPDRQAIAAAQLLLPSVEVPGTLLEACCAVCLSLGLRSMRPEASLLRTIRVASALRGAVLAGPEDLVVALRLVLGLRLAPPQDEQQEGDPAPREQAPGRDASEGGEDEPSDEALRDLVTQAEAALLPRHLLSRVEPAKPVGASSAGRSGATRDRAVRGRVVGTSERPAAPGARLDVLATLRQAAPWQRVRAKASDGAANAAPGRLHVRKSDFRYPRFRETTGTTVLFCVDASGSAAMERLAETKGAVELLLAECYARRDQVAMLAFRGRGCETLLEPTRSLVRAKRNLSALPGGGGTPLASGIMATLSLGTDLARRGQSLVSVFLTDGRGNVGLDGGTAKDRVAADLDRSARLFRASGLRAILIDTGQRPQARAEALAGSLGAEYLAMPRGGSGAMAREIGQRMDA